MSSKNQSLDDRMAAYVQKDVLPHRHSIVVRLDGRAFSKFTKDLERPYCDRFGTVMRVVAKYMCHQFNPTLVHTQSDEITMMFDYRSMMSNDMMFGGRTDKINSIFAAAATAKFNQALAHYLPGKVDYTDMDAKLPEIDCRCYAMPDMAEATNVFLWRAQDCTRNSVQMLARANYSHKQCQGKSTKDLLTMLDQDGINWAEYPDHFREGTYFRKREMLLDDPTHGQFFRKRVHEIIYHKFSSFTNQMAVVFFDELPETLKAS